MRYRGRRDLLEALLEDEKAYTQKQVDAAIETFMKG
nr:MAG TPA: MITORIBOSOMAL PROTEIN US2M, MRPS2, MITORIBOSOMAL, TRANSLATION, MITOCHONDRIA, MAMMALIAN 55S [Bacteriophage sp.]